MTESERECVRGERGESSDTYCPPEISEILAKEREKTYQNRGWETFNNFFI